MVRGAHALLLARTVTSAVAPEPFTWSLPAGFAATDRFARRVRLKKLCGYRMIDRSAIQRTRGIHAVFGCSNGRVPSVHPLRHALKHMTIGCAPGTDAAVDSDTAEACSWSVPCATVAETGHTANT